MKDIFELTGETTAANIQGSAVTSTGLKPNEYLQEVMDGAKKEMYFGSAIREFTLAPGHYQMIIPKRTRYWTQGDMTWNTAGSDNGGSGAGTGPYANTQANISFTGYDRMNNVTVKPLPEIVGVSFRRWDLKTNALNLLDLAKEDLMHSVADRIENKIVTAIGDATPNASTAAGCTVLYGGDATSENTLAAGDVITTDLIATAKSRLRNNYFWYRAGDAQYGVETKVTATYFKNPWRSTPDDPFVIYVGPSQMEALEKDSQFVNASEYGGREVVLNGEEGKLKYLGIKIIMTEHLESIASGATTIDGQVSTAGTNMTRCILMKPKAACAIVYGEKPFMDSWEDKDQDSVRVAVNMVLAVSVVQGDAIVLLDVADA